MSLASEDRMQPKDLIVPFILLAAVLAALLLQGCGTGYRSCAQASLVSVRSPVFMVSGVQTNEAAQTLQARGEKPPTVNIPVGAPVQIYAEQVMVMLWGGTASSNSILSGIEIPMMKGTP